MVPRVNWFAIVTPKVIDTRYFRYGRSGVRMTDGWIARSDDRPGGWYLESSLKYAHRWGSREAAESIAVVVGGFLPGLMGKMSVVEVKKIMNGWRRVG